MVKDLLPLIGQYRVLMYVFKDLYLVSSSVNIEPIFVAHEGMVCPRFRYLVQSSITALTVTYRLSDFVPLLFGNLVLKEVVKVCATFPRVASEKE